jgi:hypothetical protein
VIVGVRYCGGGEEGDEIVDWSHFRCEVITGTGERGGRGRLTLLPEEGEESGRAAGGWQAGKRQCD